MLTNQILNFFEPYLKNECSGASIPKNRSENPRKNSLRSIHKPSQIHHSNEKNISNSKSNRGHIDKKMYNKSGFETESTFKVKSHSLAEISSQLPKLSFHKKSKKAINHRLKVKSRKSSTPKPIPIFRLSSSSSSSSSILNEIVENNGHCSLIDGNTNVTSCKPLSIHYSTRPDTRTVS